MKMRICQKHSKAQNFLYQGEEHAIDIPTIPSRWTPQPCAASPFVETVF
jgi:hypothetical protein